MVTGTEIRFYDILNDPFDVYGFYNYREEQAFKRLPDEIGQNTNSGVSRLYANAAGGRVRFATNSQTITVKAQLAHVAHMWHMPLGGSGAFDLYLDCPQSGVSHFFDIFKPNMENMKQLERTVAFEDRKLRYVTINFPSYSDVIDLKIGLQDDAMLDHGMPYRNLLPIVYYGSSITQGACSSRPGNAYTNIISRRTNTDFINLGFSGSAKGEEMIARYMATLPMSVFVSDYDHNAKTLNDLSNTHKRLYEIIREKNSNLPYLMISRANFNNRDYQENIERREIIYDTYRQARANGDKNVYFLDGSSIYRTIHEDMCTVDGIHPNDYGFYLMADAIESELRWIWTLNEEI